MVKKREIEAYLRKYIRENTKKGYSQDSIRNRLVEHGIDEDYTDHLLARQDEDSFLRLFSVVSLMLIVASFGIFYSYFWDKPGITAYDVFEIEKPMPDFSFASNYFIWLLPSAMITIIVASLIFMNKEYKS